MFKKLLMCILFLSALYTFADDSVNTIDEGNKPNKTKDLNNPMVGSRQSGSEQIFGTPKIAPKKNNQPTPSGANEPNNPMVGGRQSGSEQLFGQTNAPSSANDNGKKYEKPANGRNEANNPMVGGRQSGSEQLFGQSAGPNSTTTNSK